MRISEIITILKSTELKQIIVGEDDDQILSLLNLALIDVYSKFNILQEEQTIEVEAGRTRYTLQENSQKVLQVYFRNTSTDTLNGVDDFEEVPLNDINCDNSVFTPQPYLLHIPNPDEGAVYLVVQAVTPPFVTKENVNTINFIVPPQLLEPISNYVGYRAYKSMNGDQQTEISSLYATYLRSVNDVYNRGLMQQSILTNRKTHERGFK